MYKNIIIQHIHIPGCEKNNKICKMMHLFDGEIFLSTVAPKSYYTFRPLRHLVWMSLHKIQHETTLLFTFLQLLLFIWAQDNFAWILHETKCITLFETWKNFKSEFFFSVAYVFKYFLSSHSLSLCVCVCYVSSWKIYIYTFTIK